MNIHGAFLSSGLGDCVEVSVVLRGCLSFDGSPLHPQAPPSSARVNRATNSFLNMGVSAGEGSGLTRLCYVTRRQSSAVLSVPSQGAIGSSHLRRFSVCPRYKQ